jgi:hypothetical protein
MGKRIALLGALAAVLSILIVDSASGSRFSINGRTFRTVFAPLNISPNFWPVSCEMTLDSSFHSSTIVKTRGALLGWVNAARIRRPCEGNGNAWFLNGSEQQDLNVIASTLPWHIRFDSFTGTLPTITSVRLQIIGIAILVRVVFDCLYQSTVERPAYLIFDLDATGTVINTRFDRSSAIPKKSGGAFCPATGEGEGTGTSRLTPTEVPAVIRLI